MDHGGIDPKIYKRFRAAIKSAEVPSYKEAGLMVEFCKIIKELKEESK